MMSDVYNKINSIHDYIDNIYEENKCNHKIICDDCNDFENDLKYALDDLRHMHNIPSIKFSMDIGTSTPSQQLEIAPSTIPDNQVSVNGDLHVEGDINVSGNLHVAGNIVSGASATPINNAISVMDLAKIYAQYIERHGEGTAKLLLKAAGAESIGELTTSGRESLREALEEGLKESVESNFGKSGRNLDI